MGGYEMFCEQCGKARINGARFCENCGAPFVLEEMPNGPPVKAKSGKITQAPDESALPGMALMEKILLDLEQVTENSMPMGGETDQILVQANPIDSESVIDLVPPGADHIKSSTPPPDPPNQTLGQTNRSPASREWIYEFSFWKNPAILITTAKVLCLSLMVPTLLMFLLTLGDGLEEALQITKTILIFGAIVLSVLLALAYIIIGLNHGGRYLVLFQLDQSGVNHIQLRSQVKRAEAMGLLTALVGLAGGNMTAAGAGLITAIRHNLYTSFNKVKSIKAVRSRNTIYLNEALTKNQIYPEQGSFDDILEYIIAHCPKNVRIIGR